MTDAAQPPLVDPSALAAYLERHLPGTSAPLLVERIRGGHSNETFFISRGQDQWVLRRPPRGPLLPTAHDVGREYRVLCALAQTNVPVPKPLIVCMDETIIGAPFYLMERLQGVVIRDALPEAFQQDVAARAGLGEELIDRLVDLHAVDWQRIGLGDLSKPSGYLERQLRRWSGQLDASRSRAIRELDQVTEWLRAHLPDSGPATIVHGDYRLDNAIYAPEPPATMRGLLDWEMAALGDPLADLGYLLSFWREARDPPAPLGEAAWRISEAPGFLTRAQLIARYAAGTKRNLENLSFYVALAIWKLAILLEGSYVRHRAGSTDDPFFATLEDGVPALARRAFAVCRGEITFL